MIALSRVIIIHFIFGCCLLSNHCSRVSMSSSYKEVIIKTTKPDIEILDPIDQLILLRLNG